MATILSSDPVEILKSGDLDVIPYARRVTALADHLGLSFPATIRVLETIPLCLARADHAEARRAIAAMIADQSEVLRPAIPAMVTGALAPLSRPGVVDVMGVVVKPLVDQMISGLVGMTVQLDAETHISRVFSQSLGVSRRRRMETELARLLEDLRAAFPDASDTTIGLKASLAILGRDALTGTLACSLHSVLASAPGRAFRDMIWPELPPRTGVPYVDREALVEVIVDGQPLAAGSSLRAHLAAYEDSRDPRAPLSFFGGGAHLCLGRSLSLDLWRRLAEELAGLPLVPRVDAFALRRDDVFRLPETFRIEVIAP